jgi:Domain of unknown function (DUF4845)
MSEFRNHLLKNQKGLGALQWILILVIASFFLLLGFRVIPLYAENQYVVAGLKDLVKLDEKLSELSDGEIYKRMENFYVINGVRGDGPKKIVIEREDEDVMVKIDYDAVANLFTDQPLLGTVDIVVHFKNHLDSRYPRECCTPLKDK